MWMIQWPEPNNVQSWFCTISYSSWISILSSTGASWTSGNEIAAPVRPFQFRMLLRIRTSYQSLSYTVSPGVVSVVHCIWDTAIASTFIHWVRNTCCSSLTRYSIPTVEKNERKKKEHLQNECHEHIIQRTSNHIKFSFYNFVATNSVLSIGMP